jgi:DNA (cytosine-5)-methyltransferase 1
VKKKYLIKIPVIDVFAGPGGLGEGFSALGRAEGRQCFKIGVSVEKETSAHSTLELRSFFFVKLQFRK